MKIIAILSHFGESPTMLAACVASLSKLKVDHLVAVDGAYQLFPGGKGSSGVDQTRVITDVADATGIGLTLHHLEHAARFRGNEVEKRSLSLRLALAFASPEDWLFVLDADEAIDEVRGDPRKLLAEASEDAAHYSLIRHLDIKPGSEDEFVAKCAGGPDARTPVRGFLRALPGLRYESNHYTVVDGEGRIIAPDSHFAVDALDLTANVILEHRQHLSDPFRVERAKGFYSAREAQMVEQPYDPSGVFA